MIFHSCSFQWEMKLVTVEEWQDGSEFRSKFQSISKDILNVSCKHFFSEIIVQRKLQNHIILFMVISWQEIKLYCVLPSFSSQLKESEIKPTYHFIMCIWKIKYFATLIPQWHILHLNVQILLVVDVTSVHLGKCPLNSS